MLVALMIWWLTQRSYLSLAARVPCMPTPAGGSVLVTLLAVLALGVFGTGIAMSFQYGVVRQAGPTVGSSVTYLILVVSVAMGVLVLGERLVWPQFVGAAVVLGAPVMIGRSKH